MVPPLANLAVLCLADIALDTDPDGADEGADEAPPRPLQEVSVRRHQLSTSVKCPSYCFTSSSHRTCRAVYQVARLFRWGKQMLRSPPRHESCETYPEIQPRQGCRRERCRGPRCPPAPPGLAPRLRRSRLPGRGSARRASAKPSPATALLWDFQGES